MTHPENHLADDGPDIRIHDMRDDPPIDFIDAVRRVVLDVESAINDRGWDQRDSLGLLYHGSHDDEHAAIGVSMFRTPDHVGNVVGGLMELAMMAVLGPDGMINDLLPEPVDAHTIGMLAAFEAWMLDGPVSEMAAVDGPISAHPDRKETRHVIACLSSGEIIHIVRIRGGEPEVISDDDNTHRSGRVVNLLRLVTSEVVQ